MELDRLQAELRSRGSHEAIDLGFAMVRRWSGPVWRAWAATVLPAWVLIVVCCWSVPWLAVLIIWWLKPLWDRVPLHVLSRSLFGATPTVREVLRALPRLWTRGTFGALTFFRLSPVRSFSAPILQLEGHAGRLATRRRQVLLRGPDATAALGLGLAAIVLEASVTIGILGLFFTMLPDAPRFAFDHLFTLWIDGHAPMWVTPVPMLAWLVGVSVVEPFYVAGGFSLYLNRRTILEGWDVDLTFRRIAARAARTAARLSGAVLLALTLFGTTVASATPTADEVHETVETVLAGDEFGHTDTQTSWQVKEWARFDWDWGDEDAVPSDGPAWLDGLGSAVEALLWVLFACGLGGLGLMLFRRWERRGAPSLPTVSLGRRAGTARPLLPDLASIPADPAAAARALWAAGNPTLALGTLYVSAVDRLATVHHIRIDAAATEGEVLRTVRASPLPDVQRTWFATLTRAWQAAAYAHRPPTEATFTTLLAGWPAFTVAGAEAA